MKTFSNHTFSVKSIQPNDKPRKWQVPKAAWLQSQMDDVPLMYHYGSLSEDCDHLTLSPVTGKDSPSPQAKYLRKIRAIFLNAAQEGRVRLFQKRISPPAKYIKPVFEYWSYPVPPK
jgi:hypothetical protein